MTDLRLILLVLGAALIAGLYGWGVYQQRGSRRRQTITHDAPSFDLPRLRPVPEGSEPFAVEMRSATAREPEIRDPARPPLPPAPAQASDLPARSGAGPDPAGTAREIITLHVAATGQPFPGRAILDAMRAADLRYGPMKIFHRYGATPVPSSQPLFSVADMFEPGNFDLDAMDGYSTRGLSLFMDARTSMDAGSVFDDMRGAAEMLARLLGGELLGDDRKALDAGRVAAIRARLGR